MFKRNNNVLCVSASLMLVLAVGCGQEKKATSTPSKSAASAKAPVADLAEFQGPPVAPIDSESASKIVHSDSLYQKGKGHFSFKKVFAKGPAFTRDDNKWVGFNLPTKGSDEYQASVNKLNSLIIEQGSQNTDFLVQSWTTVLDAKSGSKSSHKLLKDYKSVNLAEALDEYLAAMETIKTAHGGSVAGATINDVKMAFSETPIKSVSLDDSSSTSTTNSAPATVEVDTEAEYVKGLEKRAADHANSIQSVANQNESEWE